MDNNLFIYLFILFFVLLAVLPIKDFQIPSQINFIHRFFIKNISYVLFSN